MMDDIQIIVFLMFLLGLKHFLADFVWQTDTMVREKGTYGALGGLQHSAIHGVLTYLCLAWLNPVVAIFPAAFDFFVHYHVDWAKMNINAKYKYTPADHKFWLWLGIDQFAHYVTYVIIIGWYCGAF